MSTTLTVNNFKCSIGWDFEQTNSFGTNTSNIAAFSASSTFANGSGNGKAQVLYAANLTITTGATTTLDICSTTGTPIKDPLGNNVLFAKVKGIFLYYTTTTATGLLDVGGTFIANTSGSVLTGTTPLLHLYPGMFMLLGGQPSTTDFGYTVTDATQDTVTLKNNDAASIVVSIALLGE